MQEIDGIRIIERPVYHDMLSFDLFSVKPINNKAIHCHTERHIEVHSPLLGEWMPIGPAGRAWF